MNIWSNREPYGPATISLEITPEERDSIRTGVIACLGRADMADEYEAEDIFENPDQSHCEFHFSAYGQEKEVHIYGGEPPEITQTLALVMRILKRRNWEPTPFSEEGESGH